MNPWSIALLGLSLASHGEMNIGPGLPANPSVPFPVNQCRDDILDTSYRQARKPKKRRDRHDRWPIPTSP
jgi:hypothetical protein